MLTGDGPIAKDRQTGNLSVRQMNTYVEGFHQHLYLVSDEKIEEWEHCIVSFADGSYEIQRYDPSNGGQKIVATTDKSLPLPIIPNSFIEKWVNEQGKIDKVRILMFDGKPKTIYMGNGTSDNREFVQILPIEDKTFSREEVKAIKLHYDKRLINLEWATRQENNAYSMRRIKAQVAEYKKAYDFTVGAGINPEAVNELYSACQGVLDELTSNGNSDRFRYSIQSLQEAIEKAKL